MIALFSDVAAAAEMENLLDRLKTRELDDQIKRKQYKKLSNLSVSDGSALELPSGSFCYRFKEKDNTFLCVQTEELNSVNKLELTTALSSYDANEVDLDESTFLFLTKTLHEVYRIKAQNLSKETAVNLLADVSEDEYNGHEIGDVIQWFENVSIFRIETGSKLENCNNWFLGAYLSTQCSGFRAKSFPINLATQLGTLLKEDNVNPEYIYYASTSLHLRQCFLEVYRLLEALFYLPWIKALKNKIELAENGLATSLLLKETIGWRQKEEDSIQELFDLVSEVIVKEDKLNSTKAFGDLNISEATSKTIGRRIYKVRNILVHQIDYTDKTPLKLSTKCWPTLVEYILNVLLFLYTSYKADCDFKYEP